MLGIAAMLSSCSWGRDSRSAAATQQAAVHAARDAMKAAANAIGGTRLEAGGRWYNCSGGIGHQYVGGGVMTAPKGDVPRQLNAIRSAMVGAGFTDVTQLEGIVGVERDDITLTLKYHRAYQGWPVSFRSKCHIYRGADASRVKSSAYTTLEGLGP
ncbi:hypothetical protein [Deinococcus hohokamensis]|uniref:Lipoprotein n=1 Tax=Deinococcus hohokamensis TaxID=309883 RepID=A0ABV9IDT5_9DEIO